MDEANPYLSVPLAVGHWALALKARQHPHNTNPYGSITKYPQTVIFMEKWLCFHPKIYIYIIILGISLEYRREINEHQPKCRIFPDQKTMWSIKALPGSRLLRQPRQLRLLSVLFQLWKPSGAKGLLPDPQMKVSHQKMSLPQGSQLKLQVPCGVCCRLQARSRGSGGSGSGFDPDVGLWLWRFWCGFTDGSGSGEFGCTLQVGGSGNYWWFQVWGWCSLPAVKLSYHLCCWGCYLGLLHQKTLVLHQKHLGVKHYYELMGLSDHGGSTTNSCNFSGKKAFRTIEMGMG